MQGQLRRENLTFTIQTQCACCEQAMSIQLDSQLQILQVPPRSNPLVFVPMVNFSKLEDPSIIDAF